MAEPTVTRAVGSRDLRRLLRAEDELDDRRPTTVFRRRRGASPATEAPPSVEPSTTGMPPAVFSRPGRSRRGRRLRGAQAWLWAGLLAVALGGTGWLIGVGWVEAAPGRVDEATVRAVESGQASGEPAAGASGSSADASPTTREAQANEARPEAHAARKPAPSAQEAGAVTPSGQQAGPVMPFAQRVQLALSAAGDAALSRDAVSALAAGDLARARDLYRQLGQTHAGVVYPAFVTLLDARLRCSSPAGGEACAR